MLCKLVAASCGVDDGELIEVSQQVYGVKFKVRINHFVLLLCRTNEFQENCEITVDLVFDSFSKVLLLEVVLRDAELVGCDGLKALEIEEDTLKFIYLRFFSMLGITMGNPEYIETVDFEDDDYNCSFVRFFFYDEILEVNKKVLDFVGIEMRFDVAENNGVEVMVSEDEDVYPFYQKDIDMFIEKDKYYFAEDDEIYGEH